jgi:hypothetical protein
MSKNMANEWRLTSKAKSKIPEWNRQWIDIVRRTTPMNDEERKQVDAAIRQMYRQAKLDGDNVRVVFVSSPLMAAIVAGAAAAWYHKNNEPAAAWYHKNNEPAATSDATIDVTSDATSDATWRATRAATFAATFAATSDATWNATYAATRDVTNAATDAARSATSAATFAATNAATYAATFAATYAATDAATNAATRDATYAATDAATYAATYAATDAATDAATYAATDAATNAATRDATDAATYAATNAATRDATYAATNAATYAATNAATNAATRNATEAATEAATDAATSAATRNATYAATSAATDAATRNATSAATDATRNATDAATSAATRNATFAATSAATRNATFAATSAATYAATYAATLAANRDATRDANRDATRDANRDANRDATRDATATWNATDAAKIMLSAALSIVGDTSFARSCISKTYNMRNGGNQWAGWCCFLSFVRDIVGWSDPVHDAYVSYETCAIHSGPRYMHPKFCIVSDMPVVLEGYERDGVIVAHCETGPSHVWADGWALWYIDGVSVDSQIVMHPETQTIEQIDNEPNEEVRRVRIERFGWARYIAESDAECIDSRRNDIDGTTEALIRLKDGSIRMLCTCRSTGRVYAIGVDRETETCQQAQNWMATGGNVLAGMKSVNIIGAS